MRQVIIIFLVLLFSLTGTSQEQILNQCFVLVLDTETTTDLRKATFDLPFAAMRASAENKNKVIPHYAFDIESTNSNSGDPNNGIRVLSIRAYDYGEVLAENEISFFVMEWPEEMRPPKMGPFVASFPSINGFEVSTTHLLFDKPLELSDKLVSQLGLSSNTINAGAYHLEVMEVKY